MIDWRKVQERLAKAGRYSGAIDGIPGPGTWTGLVGYAAPSADRNGDAVTMRGRKLAAVAEQFGLTTPERIAGFLSNTTHETGDYKRLRENLNYSTGARIHATWPSRFKSDAEANAYARNPEKLANKVYDRPREGNTRPGDGWRFRGGGDIQLTFANNYKATGADLGLPLYEKPELIEEPAVSLLAGLSYWRRNKVNRFFDSGEPKRARSLVNAGNPNVAAPIGWPDVKARYLRLMEVLA